VFAHVAQLLFPALLHRRARFGGKLGCVERRALGESAPMNDAPSAERMPATPARVAGSKWLLVLLVSVVGLAWFSTNNSFKFYYHPDESGKVKQIATSKRNFHHPLLMLTTARLMTRFCLEKPREMSYEKIVVIGRWSSVIFTTAAAAAVAMMAWMSAGRLAGWLAGVLCLTSPQLYEFAHYFKEDPALTAGLMLSFLSFFVYWKKQSAGRLAFVGAACALAASGKYVGLVIVPFGVLVAMLAPAESRRVRWRRLGIFFAVFAAVCALVNYQFFQNPSILLKGLSHEKGGVMVGHRGLIAENPAARYFAILTHESAPVVIGLVIAGAALMLMRARMRTLPEWILLGCTAVLLAMLCSSPKVSERYALPIFAVYPWLSALALGTLAGAAGKKGGALRVACVCAAVVLTGIAVAESLPELKAMHHDFGCDAQGDLRDFIRTHLPAGAVIAQDDRANLPTADRWEYKGEELLPQKILRSEFVADLGPLEALRANGATHVVVCAPTFSRYFLRYTPADDMKEEFERRRAFYQTLKERGRLVWSSEQGKIVYTRPGIFLYEITGIEAAKP
jgi:hypothetical protein